MGQDRYSERFRRMSTSSALLPSVEGAANDWNEPLVTNFAPSTFRPEGREAVIRCRRETTGRFPKTGHSASGIRAIELVECVQVQLPTGQSSMITIRS